MPGDVKIGLLLAAGVVLFCGAKRISLQKEGDSKSVAGITESIAKGSTRSKLDVDLPADLAKKGEKAQKELASKANELESKAKQSIESTQKRTGDALAKLSPKELREKVSQTKEKGDEAIADLELPTEFGETPSRAPAKTDQARPIADEKSSLPKSPSKSTPRPEDLPPVKTTDVSRVREGATKSKLPTPASKASKADDEFGSLDLPSDLTGSSPSSLSPSSGSGPVGSKASRLKEELPKPLPDADRVGMPPRSSSASSGSPVHPYFQRFLKEGSYFVREGESLREIAFNLYQDEAKVADIVEANKGTLRSANDLKPGMKLRLP
jgi:nucleoid-associated protein YgaU